MNPGDLSCRYFYRMNPDVSRYRVMADIWDRQANEIIGCVTVGSAGLICDALNAQERALQSARRVAAARAQAGVV